jgi:hypothetical protein
MNKQTGITNPLDDPRLSSTVFFPRPDRPFGPEIPGVHDRMINVPEAQIRIRAFPGSKEAPIILFFHGNGETARDYDHAATDYASLPARLVVADYRGYGPSTGKPSLITLLPDAHAALPARAPRWPQRHPVQRGQALLRCHPRPAGAPVRAQNLAFPSRLFLLQHNGSLVKDG